MPPRGSSNFHYYTMWDGYAQLIYLHHSLANVTACSQRAVR